MFNYDESLSVEKEIAAPAKKVWDIITVPGGLSLFHPFIFKNSSESWNDVGSKDHVTYYSGIEYDREVVKWIEGTAYDLKVYEKGKHKITVSFRIIPIDDQTCKLINTIKVDFIKKLPFPVRWALLELKIKPLFTSYLCHVHKGLAYYAETGNQVKQNQFGSHPVFSK